MRWLLAACLVLADGVAYADRPAIDPETGTLVPITITAALDGASTTSASIRATFRLDVTGPATEHENQLTFGVPEGGVVTGAVVRTKDHVQRLALERVGTVDDKFTALAARPGREDHRTWGIRVDAAGGQATVGVAAPHDAMLTLDVSFEAATCFVDDVRHVAVPEAWIPALPGALVPVTPRAELDEACSSSGGGGWIALASRELGKRPAGGERVGVTASRLSLSKADITRLELSLAAELTTIPRDLHTAIIVDHSRSLTPDQRENQRAIVEAYLRAAPNSRVQVIGYARTAEPLLPGWMIASRAATRVDRAIRALPPRNGSNLDDALAAAHAWLANIQGTRRVIVFTDERLVPRIKDDPLALQPLLPDHTLVHVVDVSGGAGTVTRSDDALLAPLALATGGMAVIGGPDDNGDIDATPLARPTSLDNLAITGAGWQEKPHRDTRPCPLAFGPAMAEGQSCVWWGDGAQASGEITITGALWGTTITKIVQPDARGGRSVARILSTLSDLDADVMHEVETAAAAVNSVWSLFAMWGPRGGYDEPDGFGFITSGGGGSTGSTHDIGTGVGTVAMLPDRELQRQLAGVVARCDPRAAVTVVVETTLDEIAGVDVAAADDDRAVEDCITDGVWDTFVSLVMPPPYVRTKLVFQPG